MSGVKGLLSCLIMLFATASVFGGSYIILTTEEIEFSAEDDYLAGVEVKGQNVGCCLGSILGAEFTSGNSNFKIEGIEFPHEVQSDEEFSFRVLIDKDKQSFSREISNEKLVLDVGLYEVEVTISYDPQIASDIVNDVSIVNSANNQSALISLQGKKISFSESGLLSAAIYSIDGSMIQPVFSGKNISAGETLSVDGVAQSLASGFYFLKGSLNQKEFTLKIQK